MDLTIAGRNLSFSRAQVFLLLVALAAIGYGGYDYVHQEAVIDDAVTVNATIKEVGITQGGGRHIDYYPRVTYEYQFEGRTYTGEDIYPGSLSTGYDTRSEARAIVEPFAENETVTAYVDPQSPTDAFLKNERNSGPLYLVGFGVVALGILYVKGRQSSGDSSQSRPTQQTEPDGDLADWTVLGVDHDLVGAVCKQLIIVSFVATWLSLVGIAILLLGSDMSTGSALTHLAPFNSLGLVFVSAFLSGSALIVSLLTYSGWSYLQAKRIQASLGLNRHQGLVGLFFAEAETLNRYERRIRLTEFALVIALFLLAILLDILGVIDIPL